MRATYVPQQSHPATPFARGSIHFPTQNAELFNSDPTFWPFPSHRGALETTLCALGEGFPIAALSVLSGRGHGRKENTVEKKYSV